LFITTVQDTDDLSLLT